MNFDEAITLARTNSKPPLMRSTRVVAGVEIIEWHFDAGTVQISEVHDHDHASLLISGIGVLRSDGVDTPMVGPCLVEVKAGIEHAFWAKTDCRWDCIRAFKGVA